MQPKVCENPCSEFFYTQLPEDENLKLFQTHHLLDSEAIVMPLRSEFNPKEFVLDELSFKKAQAVFVASVSVNGRKSELLPGISTSMEDIGSEAENYIQKTLTKRCKLLLKGGGVLYVIQSMAQKIFEAWCSAFAGKHELLTPSFQAFLKLFPNDFDWEVSVEGGMDEKIQEQLIEKTLLDPLVAKFKMLKCSSFDLVLKLLNEKRHNKSRYFTGILDKYDKISPEMLNLERICIEAFAFATAANVSTPRSHFSLRRIKDTQYTHDCVYSCRSSILSTLKESLVIDMRPLLNKNITGDPLILQSMMGDSIENVLQALSNYNLLVITFNPDKPADVTDFARTVSHFTAGGRGYQKGWMAKSLEALIEGCADQKLHLSELLGKQLIGRVINHHKNEPVILVALTFNASALLYWMNPSHEAEIQKLWQIIFSYIDKIEDKPNEVLKSPVIEMIQITMRDPNFKFTDLYYIYLQIGSQVDQQSKLNPSCFSTQTEGHLFTQWRIVFEQARKSDAVKPPTCVLFFPYELSCSLKYIETLTEIPCPLSTFFHNMASNSALYFGFGQSKLFKYSQDPRRELKTCLDRGLQLMRRKQETFRLIGFLTVLPLLALKQDSNVLKAFTEDFIGMLKSPGVSYAIKQSCMALFCKTLKESNLAIPLRVFEALIKKRNRSKLLTCMELTSALVKTGEKAFLEYAYEQLELIDVSRYDYPELKALYADLLNQIIEINVNPALTSSVKNGDDAPGPASQARVQWLEKFIGKIIRHPVFLPDIKLDWLIDCYQKLSPGFLAERSNIEEELFEGILLILEQIKKHAFSIETSTWKLLLNSPNRIGSPFKAMRLIKVLTRLRLWDLTQREQINFISRIDTTKKLNLSFYFKIPEQTQANSNENSFDREIAELDTLPVHPEEIDKLLYLMGERINNKKYFERHIHLFYQIKDQIFKHLSPEQKSEVCRHLTYFHSKFLKNQPDILYSCVQSYLTLFSGIEPSELYLKSQLFELTYKVLKHPSKRQIFADEAYRKFLSGAGLLPQQERTFLRDDSEIFLQELARRQMDREIFDFFELIGYPFVTSNLNNFFVYLEALQRQKLVITVDNNPLIVYPVSPENLELFLLNAPVLPKSTDDTLRAQLTEIYQFLVLSHQKSNSMIEAYEWFRKEIKMQRKINNTKNKEEFYLRAFSFINELILSKYYLEAYQASLQLDFLPEHKVRWMKICLSFLLRNQTLYCTLLFDKKISIKSLLNEVKEIDDADWQQLFNLLISNSFEIASGESDTSKRLLASMHAIVYEIFKKTQVPSKETLKLYFHALTDNGPLNIVEEVFKEFVCSKTLPLEQSEIKECFGRFIERFHKDKSAFLLTNDSCWPCVESDFTGNSLEILVKGALKATKRHKINPPVMDRQFGKIKEITERHYNKLDDKYNNSSLYESIFNGVEFCNKPLYQVAKLFSCSTNEECLTKGAQAIVLILTDNFSDALIVRKSIELTAIYSDRMRGLNKIESLHAIKTAIFASISSPYCMNADYIKFLSLMDSLFNSALNVKRKNKNLRIGNLVFKTGSEYYEMKCKIVEKIIENPRIDYLNYSRQDKVLIGASLREIITSENCRILTGLRKNFENVKKVVDLGTLNILTKLVNKPWIQPSLIDTLLCKMHENQAQIINYMQRESVFKRYNRTMHHKMMDSEQKALKSSCIICITVCLMPLLMITGIFLGIMSSVNRSNLS